MSAKDFFMKITDTIFQIGGDGYTSPQDAAVYLIRNGELGTLVDAGCGDHTDILLENIKARGLRPENIQFLLLTHCHYDHTGGAARIRESTGCRIIAHEKDAVFIEAGDSGVTAARWYGRAMIPFAVDQKLTRETETLHLGDCTIQAIHIPGHSPGSVAYTTWSDGRKVLFGQDVHGPLDPELLSNRSDYTASLEKLLREEADILCEGHYGIYRGKGAVARFIQSFL